MDLRVAIRGSPVDLPCRQTGLDTETAHKDFAPHTNIYLINHEIKGDRISYILRNRRGNAIE
jgi:hypothetical protein